MEPPELNSKCGGDGTTELNRVWWLEPQDLNSKCGGDGTTRVKQQVWWTSHTSNILVIPLPQLMASCLLFFTPIAADQFE